MKVAIIGQGYVGTAFRDLVANHSELVTYDPIYNPEYPDAEIRSCDFAAICVPTPMGPSGECDTSAVEAAISQLPIDRVLIKSTVAPGTTTYLAKEYHKKIAFSPEYIGESTYYNPYYPTMKETGFLIVGGEQADRDFYFDFFEPILGPHTTYFGCEPIEAELIKYMENSYFASKITFVNEFHEIVGLYGANWHRVREGWLLDRRVARSHTSVFKDHPGYAGKCLPKDTEAIAYAARHDLGYRPALLEQVIASNRERIERSQDVWAGPTDGRRDGSALRAKALDPATNG